MAAQLPAHQQPRADESDEDLSDDAIRELLLDAERRLRSADPQPIPSGPVKLPSLNPGHVADTYLKTKGEITRLDQSKLVSEKDRALSNGIKKLEDPVSKRQKKKEKTATAGASWFDMPKTELTPELRRDLQLLKMRGTLDPKRFYKKESTKSDIPAYSQVGTIIEGATEFYSSRLNNKERKRTLAEEVLAQEEESGKFKKKYDEILKTKASGKKAYYKALKAKRSKGKVVKP